MAKKKSALDDALNYVNNQASGLYFGAKKAISNVTSGFGNFYKNFSQGYDNFKRTQTVNQQRANDFSQNAYKNFQSGIDNFKTNVSTTFKKQNVSSFLNTTKQEIGTGVEQAKGGAKVGLGVLLKTPFNLVKNAPLVGNPITNFLVGSRSKNDITLGKLYPNLKLPGEKITEQIANKLNDSARINIKKSSAMTQKLPQIKDEGFLNNIKNPEWVKRGLLMNAPSFVTSFLSGALVSMITKNPTAGMTTAFVTAFPQNAGEMYLDAKEKGADEITAQRVAQDYGVVASMLDTLGIGSILKRLPGGKQIKGKLMGEIFLNLTKSSLSEGSTEGMQQVLSNALAKVYYDPQRPLFKEVPENVFFGGLMGGATSGITDVGLAGAQKYSEMTPEEQQGGYIRFPGSENLNKEEYREEVKKRLNEAADDILSKTDKQEISSLKDERKLAREFKRNPDKFIDRYQALPTSFNNQPVISDEDSQIALNALNIIEMAENPEDYLDPKYAESETLLRSLAAKYVDPKLLNEESINDVITALRSKLTFDQGNIQAPPSIQEGIEEAIPKPTENIVNREEQSTAPTSPLENQSGGLPSVISNEEVQKLEGSEDQTPELINEEIKKEATVPIENISEEDRALSMEALNKSRGYAEEEPQTITETVLPRSVTRRINELNKMVSEFESESDQIEQMLANYDLIKKATPNLIKKEALRKLQSELKKDIKKAQSEIADLETQTKEVTTEVAETIPTNEELALKALNESRGLPPTEIPTNIPSDEELALKALKENKKNEFEEVELPETPAPGIEDVKTENISFIPSTDWQVIPEGTAVPPGGEFRLDLENNVTYGKWSEESVTESANKQVEKSIKETQQASPLTDDKKERGHTETVRENEAYRENVRKQVFSDYTPISEQELFESAQKYVLDNPAEAAERLKGKEPTTPELIAIGEALFLKKQHDADIQEELGNFKEAFALDKEASEIDNALSERFTPAAQILHYAKRFASKSPKAMIRWAEKIFDEANQVANLSPIRLGKRLFGGEWKVQFSEENKQKILKEQRKINRMPDGEEKWLATQNLMREVVKDIPPSVIQYTDAYRYQNMLIDPLTQLRNIVNNAGQILVTRPATIATRGVIDQISSLITGNKATHRVSDVLTFYSGMKESLPGAIEEFQHAWRGESPIEQPDLKTGLHAFTGKGLPTGLTIAGRSLEGADRFFTKFLADGEYAVQKAQGATDSEAKKAALDIATRYLYRNSLDPFNRTGQGHVLSSIDRMTDWIIKGRRIVGPLGWFVPYVRVPMAVAKMGIEYSPMGISTVLGSTQKQEQVSKMMLGTVALGLGFMAAAAGNTTWEAPKDEKAKKLWYASGKKEFAFKVGKMWIPFQYLGPFAYAVAFPAAMKHYTEDAPTAMSDEAHEKAAKILLAELNMWSKQTFLTGLGNFVRLMQGDVDYSTESNLAFLTGQLIPMNGIVRYVNTIIDPVYRKARSFEEGLAKNIPGLSQGIEPIVDPTGQEVKRNWTNFLMPWALGFENEGFDQLYEERNAQLQQNAVVNKIKKQAEEGNKSSIVYAGSGKEGSNKKETEALRKNVNTLFETYDQTEDDSIRQNIRNTIENMGVDFHDGYSRYLNKDTAVTQEGLSEGVQKKLARSNEYDYAIKLQNQYLKTGVGGDILEEIMNEKGISKEDLDYDRKTRLEDDVQLDEIAAGIDGLTGDDLIATLVSYRKISEGSRKALLTDTIIGKLEDQGIIGEGLANYLKAIGWDEEKGTFKMLPQSGKGKKKNFEIDVPRTSGSFKPRTVKISGPSARIFAPIPRIPAKQIKTRTPRPKFQSIQGLKKPKRPSLSIRNPVRTLGGLGGSQ